MSKKSHELRRDLKYRHISMISLGGAIGTGLFLASGQTVAQAGPGGALLAYSLIGVMVYFLMTSLGEMAAFMPTSGSFSTYTSRYVEPSLGFATGWNFWYNWAITLAFELSAAAVLMKYWFPNVPAVIFSAIFLIVIILINIISVKGFGETEFWLASIKIFIVILFLVVGVLVICGVFSGEHGGFRNWTVGDAPFHNGISGVISIFMIAGFAFQGTEFVGVAAGESKDPHKDVPKAVRSVFWRIIVFYVMTIFVIGTLIPYFAPNLTVEDVAVSPFTMVFAQIGIPHAADFINAVVLAAVLSAGNSGTYSATRMLYALAKQGDAPKLLSKTNRRGVPIYALLATVAVGSLALLSTFFSEGAVYTWLLNLSALAGFMTWVFIALSHYRFRKGFLLQGHSISELPYAAKLFPVGPILALFACIFVIVGQNYEAFLGDTINWGSIIATYLGVPLFLIVWLIHKHIHKSKIVKYSDMEF
jgi:lysine-specific permease